MVWEESIALLPHKVRFVFLSATIPNAKEFAAWVAKIHHQTCHVVYTDYRPTPLQHYMFPNAGDGLYLVVDEKGRFREDNFQKAMASLNAVSIEGLGGDGSGAGGGKKKKGRGGKGGKRGPSDLFRIVKMIMERNYDPVIVFSFSKRECESYAMQMSNLDFTTDDEKRLISEVFNNAMDSLSDEDKTLPQVDLILPLLKRGVGIHHGGLLPILKEVIEIMFQESLIKCLFATETFSMGINMPAKTVVFTATRKFDGRDFRWVSAGEYIQMSGRAGRRGLDDRGIVIQMVDEKMDPASAKEMLRGQADPLNSTFHLGYNMLLNLMRVEGSDPEQLMALSFFQFQNEKVGRFSGLWPMLRSLTALFLWPACACLETSSGRQGVGDQGRGHQAREARRAAVLADPAHGQDSRRDAQHHQPAGAHPQVCAARPLDVGQGRRHRLGGRRRGELPEAWCESVCSTLPGRSCCQVRGGHFAALQAPPQQTRAAPAGRTGRQGR